MVEAIPNLLSVLESETERLGFPMASERQTGALLRTLVASKPGGQILELGTGTGLSSCWLLDGMDTTSRLQTVDNDETVLTVARRHLGKDPRITITCADGGEFLKSLGHNNFDMIFADAWPGKFSHLNLALERLSPGGLYVIDDLLPQPSWPEGHAPRVPKLIAQLKACEGLAIVELEWATGILIATKLRR